MELTLPPVYTGRNFKNGRWLKGVTPFNKGKKWSEYMSEDAQRRSAKGWKNIEEHRSKGIPESSYRTRSVVIVYDDGSWTVLPSIAIATEWMKERTGRNCSRDEIWRCCNKNRSRTIVRDNHGKLTGKVNNDHRRYGARFYYESDVNIWTKKIK